MYHGLGFLTQSLTPECAGCAMAQSDASVADELCMHVVCTNGTVNLK